MSKLLKYETYYDILQPNFGQKNIQLPYVDTDAFLLSVNTEVTMKDLKKLENIFDFSNIDENHEVLSNKNKEVMGKFKIETPKIIWIDEFVCLGSKMYAFKCGNDKKSKLKSVSKSQSKIIDFEEYYNCLFEGKYH